jgi:sulfite reductase alpha subunit-like flavoprotein
MYGLPVPTTGRMNASPSSPSPHAAQLTQSTSEADVEFQNECSVLVLYATETGTALDIAEQLAHEARRLQYDVRPVSIDAYPLVRSIRPPSLPTQKCQRITRLPHQEDLLHEPLVLFVVSTTGSGVPPRSMATFWTLLRSDLPPDVLDELHFAVFWSRDSVYERFCWAAKMLRRRLGALEAMEIVETGVGDEQMPLGCVFIAHLLWTGPVLSGN